MATIKLKVKLSIGYANASKQDVIDVEIPDDATEVYKDDLMRIAAMEWSENYIDLAYSEEL